MPPKAKFTKEQIVDAAIAIIRENGASAVSARSIAKTLGTSACPIFTVFKNMEELQQMVLEKCKQMSEDFVEEGLKEQKTFKMIGYRYILFAYEEPKIFRLLYMREQREKPSLEHVLESVYKGYQVILDFLEQRYNLEKEKATKLYHHMWIYVHGIASLVATNACKFTKEEVLDFIDEVYRGVYKQIIEG